MTPQEVVKLLDSHVIGQNKAKKSVAIALRDRWRRMQLNDDLREQGWPLTRPELEAYTKKIFPNTVINTRDKITDKFKVGQVVTGNTSGASGTIIRRNLNFGQIVVNRCKSL